MPARQAHPPVQSRFGFSFFPRTRRGRWAVALGAAAFVLVTSWSIVPYGAVFGFACGVVSGVLGGLAIARDRERAFTVWLTLAPLAFVVVFVLAELLIGHD
jgi:hypothetical protein